MSVGVIIGAVGGAVVAAAVVLLLQRCLSWYRKKPQDAGKATVLSSVVATTSVTSHDMDGISMSSASVEMEEEKL